MKKQRKRVDRFVVGYAAAGNCVYGSEHILRCDAGIAQPMPLNIARQLKKKKFHESGATIFKLVPLKPKRRRG